MNAARANTAPAVQEIAPPPLHKTALALATAAAELFAERGFHATTRDIAARLGVTQALIYKYFQSKTALVEAALDVGLPSQWSPEWDALLADPAVALAERLRAFYGQYLASVTVPRSRLWMHATLAGIDLPKRYSVPLTERVLKPIVAGLRRDAGLPGFDARAMTRGERELAMVLHANMVFLIQRRNLYRIPLQNSVEELMNLQIDVYLPGAREMVVRLSQGHGGDSMAVPLLR